jgi:hypothetical protein
MAIRVIAYGLVDPAVDDARGVFANQALAERYAELVENGTLSLRDAMEIGVFVEELDIHHIKDLMLPNATQLDVQRVLTNLLDGSYNHLAAFNRQLATL